MLAFELFNYSTTDYALTNLLGDLRFVGLRWATILAIAFCGMDFAGIARLFTPEKGAGERTEVWYLIAAWFLAATMNAMLTWWGVSLALLGHQGLGNEILSRETLLSAVPIFVAVLVWVIRILLIGMVSMAGERLFSFMDEVRRESETPAPAAARLPTAAWTGGSRPNRIVGAGDDEFSRPRTVAEKHGYGRAPQAAQTTARPAAPPPVRPAPKTPVSQPGYGNGQTARKPVTIGAGNGGNGHGLSYHSLDED
jgi:hypothetical protein